MAVRSLIAFAVVIALQALAGCGRPAESGVARDDRSAGRKAEFETREARLRKQVEAGTFGLAQLYPGGAPVDARRLPPLRPPSAVRVPVPALRLAQSSSSETPVHVASPGAGRQPDPCIYKPVMSEADVDACR